MKEQLAGCLGAIIGVLLVVLGLSIICAFPAMWLWNWLMPYLFNLPTINIWQTMGLILLCAFLIKGFNITWKK